MEIARSAARRLLGGLLVLTAACSPAASGQPAPSATQGPVRDEVQNLRVSVRQMAANPTPAASNGDHHVYWAMFDKLTQFEGDFVIKPSIAERWEVFTYEQIRDRRWPQISYFGSVTGATAVNPTTVEFALRAPDGTIAAAGTYFWVFPKRYFEQVGFEGFVAKPQGSGPYEMTEFRANDVIRFKKRATPHAFRTPVATDLSFRAISDNSAVIAGLQTGEIDVSIDPNLTADQADRLKAGGVGVLPRVIAVTSLNIPQGSYEARNTPLANPKVRQAIAYAINKDVIANRLFGGYAKVAPEMAIPTSPYAIPGFRGVPYEPATARRLLAEAGYPNGFTVATGIEWTTGFTSQEVILAVQSDLKAVGIEAESKLFEQAIIIDKAFGRNNLTLGDLTIGRSPEVIGLGPSRTFLGCNKPVGGPRTSLNWCNADWDRLMDQAYAEGDAARRAALLQQAARLQMEGGVYVPLYLEPSFTLTTAKVGEVQFQHPGFFKLDPLAKLK
jgi:ABC-type transport system substrate-binding protein